jgi:lysophospholipase L1-like esterase
MKIITVLILCFQLCQLIYSAEVDTIKANNPLIEYTGRIDFSNPFKPKFSYSGVSIRACFQGTSVSLILIDEGSQNYYNVILDNVVISRLQTKAGLNTYSIANGLEDTIHEIEIFKLTEEWLGKTQFCGYLLDMGKTLVEISNKREILIEFIGNSITCGYGNEGINGDGGFTAKTENHYLTYAALTSRCFNARHLAVCKSGIGIYRNYDGPVNGNTDCMTNNYQRILFSDASPIYKFDHKPDLICIDLGTNDFSTGKGDSAQYVKKYLQFIDTIQLKNAGADILCLLGPMLGGTDLFRVRKYLNFIVDSANSKNIGKVFFFEMSQQTGNLGIGSDYHPTVAQHLKNAKELINYISILKGWQIEPDLVLTNLKYADEIVLEFNTDLQDITGNFEGFTVNQENTNISVSKVTPNAIDKSKVHIVLATSLSPGKKISISYSKGTIEAINNIKLENISSMNIGNSLTVTNLTNAITDQNGGKVTLSFNKTMLKPLNLEGLLLFDSQNIVLSLTQYKLNSKNIELYLKNKIFAGDTVFLNISPGFYSNDKVELIPVSKYQIKNNSILTSIKDNQKSRVTFYPNPTHNRIVNYNIEENFSGNIIADLFDLNGKLIDSRVLKSPAGTIDFRNNQIKNGNYIIKIYTSNKNFSNLIFFD